MASKPAQIVNHLRENFNAGITLTYSYRYEQLKNLERLYDENTDAMVAALSEDLHKTKMEAIISEVEYLKNDLRNILYDLHNWMEPESCCKPLANILDKVFTVAEPYGVVLIIGAWNYPLQLIFAPLAGAIAAGNCVVIKPSEIAVATSKLISELIPKYLDQRSYSVVTGGVPETTELLKQKFNYIFYTGSSSIGKIVHKAAAEHLTPTTLELGGKSPVILDKSSNIERAVTRIMWGKCYNAGQSCIAPDYLLCTKEVEKKFIEVAKNKIREWYGEKNIIKSKDYGRIINRQHYDRILGLLKNANIAYGGEYNADELFIHPTIVTNCKASDRIMNEEIFGPILPIFNVENMAEAIAFINNREKPLVLYLFTANKSDIDLVTKNTSSGNLLVNDTMMHFFCSSIPFGGIGNSGMGKYHGKTSFDTFSHKKGVMVKANCTMSEMMQFARYPPYNDNKITFIKLATRRYPNIPGLKYFKYFGIFLLGVGFMAIQTTLYAKSKQNSQ